MVNAMEDYPYVVMAKDMQSFLVRKKGMTIDMYKEIYRIPNVNKIEGYFRIPLDQPYDVRAFAKKYDIRIKDNAQPYLVQEEINLDDLIDS